MNIEKICRICLKENKLYSHIFEKLFQYECLFYEIVNDVCQLDVEKEDGLSVFVCNDCCNKINEFHEFKKLSHRSGASLQRIKENTLKKKYKNNNPKKPLNPETKLTKLEKSKSVDKIHKDDRTNYNFPEVFIKIEEGDEQLGDYASETCESSYCEEEMESNRRKAYIETNDGFEDVDDSNDNTTRTKTKMDVEPERNFVGIQTEIFLVPSNIDRDYSDTDEKDPLEVEPDIVEISDHELYSNESVIEEPHPVAVVREVRSSKFYACNSHAEERMVSTSASHPTRENMKEIHSSKFHGYNSRAEERMVSAGASHLISENVRYKGFSRETTQGQRMNYYQPPSPTNYKRVYRKDRKVKCDICGKGFPSNSHIIIHKRVHTGDKPFKCFTCGRSFSQVQNLATHERTHTGEKPFKCPLCGKSFSNKSTLNKHGRIHSGEKPFFCHICGMSFAQKGNLTIHIQGVHNTKNSSIQSIQQYKPLMKSFSKSQ